MLIAGIAAGVVALVLFVIWRSGAKRRKLKRLKIRSTEAFNSATKHLGDAIMLVQEYKKDKTNKAAKTKAMNSLMKVSAEIDVVAKKVSAYRTFKSRYFGRRGRDGE
jgi:hypothetical protein